MYKANPKQIGSNLIDCTPQKGPCPVNCNQCYYNRDSSLFSPNIPTKKKSINKIVRFNALHDSNIHKALVLKTAKKYKDVFFNTSIADFDFPGPVVYTANPEDNHPVEVNFLRDRKSNNIMFIRLRVSYINLYHLKLAVRLIHDYSNIPIVLTFMRYYDEPTVDSAMYIKRKHILNVYWCPTKYFKRLVMETLKEISGNQVTMCGTIESDYCIDCRNCEAFYWITKKRMKENDGQI